MDPHTADPANALPQPRLDLPDREITVNAVVALNMSYFRRAAGLTQEELGDLIGWGKSMVSTAERSADAKRVRQFSADDLVKIAAALQIPLGALFLPPADSGTAVRYVLTPPLPGEEASELTSLMRYAFPDFTAEYGSSPVLDAYRQRLIAAGLGRLDKSMDMALHILAEAQRAAGATADAARRDADEILSRARDEAERVADLARSQAEQVSGDLRRAKLSEQNVLAEHGREVSMEEVARILALAQQTADQVIAEARRGADKTLTRARDEALAVLELGRRQAEQITGDARHRADSLERDAQERHRQAMGSLVARREELERRVDELRAFEREYRTRLQLFLEANYRDLWSGAEGIDADDLLRELRTRAKQHSPGRFSVLMLSDDGTYDSFTSDDIETCAEQQHGGTQEDEGSPPGSGSREGWEQAGAADQGLPDQSILGPYMVADKEEVVTVTPAAQAREETPEREGGPDQTDNPEGMLP